MHRIDTPTAQKDKFGAGKNGFTRGNPQTGTPATDLDDDYFDMLQEEMASVVEAAGITLDKSKHNQLLQALSGRLINVQNFTASGTYTPSVGTKFIIVEVLGGGGGGGSNAATAGTNQVSVAAGGGGGGYAIAKMIASTYSVIVGAGGIGGAAAPSGTNGTDGGSSSIGGVTAPGGGGGPLGNPLSVLPAAGNISGGSIPPTGNVIASRQGEQGVRPIAYSTTSIVGGGGGDSIYGVGGPGRYTQNSPVNVAGYDATGNGSGGGGSASTNLTGATSLKGGNGTSGKVIVWEYA